MHRGARGSHASASRPELSLLALIVLAALALRLAGLWSIPLDFDEIATNYFAHLSVHDLVAQSALREPNPPSFYLLEHALLRAGLSGRDLRLPTILAGTASVPLAWAIARRLDGRVAGLFAAILVATSPTSLAMAIEARVYALVAAFTLAAILLLLLQADAARETGGAGSKELWLGIVLASAALLWLHDADFVIVLSLNLLAFILWAFQIRNRRFAAAWLLSQCLAALAWSPWVPVVLRQARDRTIANFSTAPTLANLKTDVMRTLGQKRLAFAQPWFDRVVLLFAPLGAFLARWRAAALALLATALAIGPAIAYAASLWKPILNGKTELWILAPFLILVAIAFARLGRPGRLAFAVLLAAHLAGLWRMATAAPNNDGPALVAAMRREVCRNDPVYFDPVGMQAVAAYAGWRMPTSLTLGDGALDWYRAFPGRTLAEWRASPAGRSAKLLWVVQLGNPGNLRRTEARLGPAWHRAHLWREGYYALALEERGAPGPLACPVGSPARR